MNQFTAAENDRSNRNGQIQTIKSIFFRRDVFSLTPTAAIHEKVALFFHTELISF